MFINASNYYLFEMGGGGEEAEKFKQLRKIVNGKSEVLARDDEHGGYEINAWYSITIVMINEEIRIFTAVEGWAAYEVFPEPIEDKDLKEGTIALATYKAAGTVFDNLRMHPPEPKGDFGIESILDSVVSWLDGGSSLNFRKHS
jgi:hypothetical protein